jgi:hypothetical protein
MMDNKNLRKSPRKESLIQFDVINQVDKSLYGLLLDISFSGLLILSDSRKRLGEITRIKVILPAQFYIKNDPVFSIECKWSKQNETGSYNSGFEFLKESQTEKSREQIGNIGKVMRFGLD